MVWAGASLIITICSGGIIDYIIQLLCHPVVMGVMIVNGFLCHLTPLSSVMGCDSLREWTLMYQRKFVSVLCTWGIAPVHGKVFL